MARFRSLLVANRGEIACRVISSAQSAGLRTIAVYSDADANARHVDLADDAVRLGPAAASESYLDVERVMAAARASGAEAIHPGYGFLSENPSLVSACEEAGMVFVGPSAAAMKAMGLKDAAKRLMEAAGVPVVPGYHGKEQNDALLEAEAERIGYPVLIKARAGGGGKGMRKVDAAADFRAALDAARREAAQSFADDSVLIEKFVQSPRHIEVQVMGDSHGNVVHLFERDCSLQRRHQKVIEEAPAPGMTSDVREAMTAAAVRAAKAIDYVGAGTIEFIVDGSGELRSDGFWFMEMNTRLQVEHPVTELLTGIDLVDWQLRVAAGEPLPKRQEEITACGHAVEARLYAEDPDAGFLPATGTLLRCSLSRQGRVDTGVREGDSVLPHYDPLMAKLITHGDTREQAFARLARQLADSEVVGAVCNREFLWRLCTHPAIVAGKVDTGFIEREGDALFASAGAGATETVTEDTLDAVAAVAAVTLPEPGAGSEPDGIRLPAHWQLWGNRDRSCTLLKGRAGAQQSLTFDIKAGSDGRHEVQAVPTDSDASIAQEAASQTLNCQGIEHELLPTDATRTVLVVATGEGEPLRRLMVFMHERTIAVQSGAFLRHYERPLHGGSGAIGASADVVLAPMPGRIVTTLVSAGDDVAAGDTLLVLEAMKMEQDIKAASAAVVAEVAVAEGDQVEQAALLVRFESTET